MSNALSKIELSIVVPALNEAPNLPVLVQEVRDHVIAKGVVAELIVVDDGSTDETPAVLQKLAAENAFLRVLRRDKPQGQSSAMYAGIQAAVGEFVATLDADLQNVPADLPIFMDIARKQDVDMVQGVRARRQDNVIRKVSSWIGRTARKLILSDPIRDTGCSTRVVRAHLARQVPMQFKGMHRFVPVYVRMIGGKIVEHHANHRPRTAGVTKYGVLNRAFAGLLDCFAMRWMINRHRSTQARLVTPALPTASESAVPRSETSS